MSIAIIDAMLAIKRSEPLPTRSAICLPLVAWLLYHLVCRITRARGLLSFYTSNGSPRVRLDVHGLTCPLILLSNRSIIRNAIAENKNVIDIAWDRIKQWDSVSLSSGSYFQLTLEDSADQEIVEIRRDFPETDDQAILQFARQFVPAFSSEVVRPRSVRLDKIAVFLMVLLITWAIARNM
jgi:hypothetical protein